MTKKKLFDLHENIYYKKSQFDIIDLECEKEFWNIDETISELSYLTHDYFRYYGKFPSKVAKMILEDLIKTNIINKEMDFIMDNYAGSGTTLVESKLLGVDSIGLDINPFAVLACRVKTYNYNVIELRKLWEYIKSEIFKYDIINKDNLLSHNIQKINEDKKNRIKIATLKMIDNVEFIKWFSEEALFQLMIIKDTLLEIEYSRMREFFDLGFFAIIRRVSYAYDAEVRPHVNKKKRKRDVIQAYIKKINEMLDTMDEWNVVTKNNIYSNAYLVSNTNIGEVKKIVENKKKEKNKQLGAIISHPPYLNCFDYIPVYKLKFLWADGFKEIFGEMTYEQIKSLEIKSYPVNSN